MINLGNMGSVLREGILPWESGKACGRRGYWSQFSKGWQESVRAESERAFIPALVNRSCKCKGPEAKEQSGFWRRDGGDHGTSLERDEVT